MKILFLEVPRLLNPLGDFWAYLPLGNVSLKVTSEILEALKKSQWWGEEKQLRMALLEIKLGERKKLSEAHRNFSRNYKEHRVRRTGRKLCHANEEPEQFSRQLK